MALYYIPLDMESVLINILFFLFLSVTHASKAEPEVKLLFIKMIPHARTHMHAHTLTHTYAHWHAHWHTPQCLGSGENG